MGQSQYIISLYTILILILDIESRRDDLIDIDEPSSMVYNINIMRLQRFYIDPHTHQLIETTTNTNPNNTSIYSKLSLQSITQLLYDTYLPINYPDSVTSDYLQYQVYDTVQGLCSYLRGLLCTQSVLIGIGVGNSTATINNAMINWLLRDGIGMLGSIIYGYYNSAVFSINIKQYRIFADCINDIGLTLDLLSALVPDRYFIYIICMGTLCRSICGVAGM